MYANNMKLMLATTIVYLFVFGQCDEPKDEVEIIPEAMEKERKKVKLFWSIMYEVCHTFCVWRTFCRHFCELFNPDQDPDIGINFGLTVPFNKSNSSDKTVWLYRIVSEICEDNTTCIQKCLNMEMEDESDDTTELWQPDEQPTNVLRSLYELTKSYFAECAKITNKPTTVVDSFTAEVFCREITSAGREFMGHCLNLLA